MLQGMCLCLPKASVSVLGRARQVLLSTTADLNAVDSKTAKAHDLAIAPAFFARAERGFASVRRSTGNVRVRSLLCWWAVRVSR